jgi:hypothetical protein
MMRRLPLDAERDEKDQAGAAKRPDPTQAEDDRSLVFLQNPQARGECGGATDGQQG